MTNEASAAANSPVCQSVRRLRTSSVKSAHTKTSIPSAPAFQLSVISLSCFSACDKYKENKSLEESAKDSEMDPVASTNSLAVCLACSVFLVVGSGVGYQMIPVTEEW